ncbi:helix-turn-helix domain-containing protein [Pseudovibrio sp. SPO723]|uniref:helix-turn-helix domain-containing protein n=1 Tax=Nesiotobacter zosterae TaxID=392721 RepID=UPI0039B4A928
MNYTPETLAERWKVCANTVRSMCKKGELLHFRTGRLYRIPHRAVEDYECGSQSIEENGTSASKRETSIAEYQRARTIGKLRSA